MPFVTLRPNFRPLLAVTSLKVVFRSILSSMGLDHVLIEFVTNAAIGAATVLLVILFVGIGIPHRSTVTLRRTRP